MKWILWVVLMIWAQSVFSKTLEFPAEFEWCVATAGHQVEGDNIHSDWWQFEQKPGAIKNGERSGKASFHRERLEEDVQIMKNMNVETYRFSIEWSRLEPRQGEYDAEAIAYYHREIDLLKKNNIRPMVTLHHFVQPQWFTERGGWLQSDSADIFFKYTQKVEAEFGSKVDFWITFNEPMVLLIGGFGEGFFSPGEKHWDLWTPLQNILVAHAKIYHYFHDQARARNQSVKIGMAHHLRPLIANNSFVGKLLNIPNFLLNWNVPLALKTGHVEGVAWKNVLGLRLPWYTSRQMDELKNTQDFLGINYYTRELITLKLTPPFFERNLLPELPYSELLWSIDPEGFYETFKLAHERFPELPFYVTENGLADAKDQWREHYLTSHLAALHKAMTELPHKIEGYCHWSLLDNFEWHEGFAPRFGLIEVDYEKNGERRLRPSAHLATKIFSTHSIEIPESETRSE